MGSCSSNSSSGKRTSLHFSFALPCAGARFQAVAASGRPEEELGGAEKPRIRTAAHDGGRPEERKEVENGDGDDADDEQKAAE